MTEVPTPPPASPQTPPPAAQAPQQNLAPHRGTTVLVLGILGLVVCVICGIIAWVMGKNDLKEIDAGRMDPTGRGVTNAVRICGMISTIFAIVGLGIWLLMLIFAGGAAVVSS